jgi:hypothetical protein
MRYRTFGRNGWQVSEVGYGMWGMAGWTGSDDEQSRARSSARSPSAAISSTRRGRMAPQERTAAGSGAEETRPHGDPIVRVATKIPPKN